MKDKLSMRICEVVGSNFCVASDDGQKVYDQIAAGLRAGKRVNISFLNIKSLTTAFLNAAIGQLYGEFTEKEIKRGLSVTDLEPDDIARLKFTVKLAKQYFKDPKQFKKSVREA